MLTPSILSLFAVLGLFAGLLAGLLGIGGGIILTPLFLVIFPLVQVPDSLLAHVAFGTSLAIIIPTSISSALTHRRLGNVNSRQVGLLALGGIAGSFCGGLLASTLDTEMLKGLFGVMQIAVSLRLFTSSAKATGGDLAATPPPRSGLVLAGLAGGAFSAFFGVGGGIIAVPLMVLLLGIPMRTAVGNSSALIVISSLTGTATYILTGWGSLSPPAYLGYVNLLAALIVSPFTIMGARFGARLAGKIPHDTLIRIFALLVLLVGLRIASSVFIP
ncbi:MAG: hypothetical protein C0621_09010 [Desulfuromonas sp.]|nr:MAG: hypothetical protein C0621_09010 [Desulfuromonas sp.]